MAGAERIKHSNAENGIEFLGLATLIAVVAIRHVATRDNRSERAKAPSLLNSSRKSREAMENRARRAGSDIQHIDAIQEQVGNTNDDWCRGVDGSHS